jgi:tetratricopeptide (TPR) repeat protein
MAPKYDRTRILAAATRARARGRRRKAIALYRWVLAAEPGNVELHAKLAPLLARTQQPFDAWQSYCRAGRAYLDEGKIERALAVYREAAGLLPRVLEPWLAIAELEQERGRPKDAIVALLDGRRHLRGGHQRAEAICLLRRVQAVEPWTFGVVLDLARLLARSRQIHEASMLLQELASRSRGRELRRVRAAQWRLEPTLGHTWLWIRSLAGGTGSTRAARA